eukprot:scaffold1629_cov369-Prasinococcus_capsulatus_cf.AAC.42
MARRAPASWSTPSSCQRWLSLPAARNAFPAPSHPTPPGHCRGAAVPVAALRTRGTTESAHALAYACNAAVAGIAPHARPSAVPSPQQHAGATAAARPPRAARHVAHRAADAAPEPPAAARSV